MKLTTTFLLAIIAVSVTSISLRREDPPVLDAAMEDPVAAAKVAEHMNKEDMEKAGEVMEDPLAFAKAHENLNKDDMEMVGSDPKTWGPQEKMVHEEKPMPMPKVELPPECKHVKAKDGKGEGSVICDMKKEDVPKTEGGKKIKLRPQNKEGKEMEGGMKAVLEGGKEDELEEKKDNVSKAMKGMMGGDDDKEAHKEHKMGPAHMEGDDKKEEHSWGPAHEKVEMGPKDAKMQLVKKEAGEMEMEVKEAEKEMGELGPVDKLKMEKDLDEAKAHFDKEDDKEAARKEPKVPENCAERVDKEGNEKLVCKFEEKDLKEDVHKKQKHDEDMKKEEKLDKEHKALMDEMDKKNEEMDKIKGAMEEVKQMKGDHKEKMMEDHGVDDKDMGKMQQEMEEKEAAFGKMKKHADMVNEKKKEEEMKKEKEAVEKVKVEMKDEMKDELKGELKEELKNEMKKEKKEMKDDMEKEVKKQMKEHGVGEKEVEGAMDKAVEEEMGPMEA